MKYVGKVYYNAHPSTPIVIGDFQLMKKWPGEPDGEAEGLMDLEEGEIFGFSSLHLTAPHVFVHDGILTLIASAEPGGSEDVPEGETLEYLLDGDAEAIEMQTEIEVTSGGLVVSVAYNATPEEGAATDHLDELCYHDEIVRLPKQVPGKPEYHTELAIIPIKSGTYRVEWSEIEDFERCQLTLV